MDNSIRELNLQKCQFCNTKLAKYEKIKDGRKFFICKACLGKFDEKYEIWKSHQINYEILKPEPNSEMACIVKTKGKFSYQNFVGFGKNINPEVTAGKLGYYLTALIAVRDSTEIVENVVNKEWHVTYNNKIYVFSESFEKAEDCWFRKVTDINGNLIKHINVIFHFSHIP